MIDSADDTLTVARAQLRASLTAYVSVLRSNGVPPERMLVLVKSAVAIAVGAAIPQWLSLIAYRTIVADAVRWSVNAYYDRS